VRSRYLLAMLAPFALAAAACAGSSAGQPVLTGAAPARVGAGQSFVIIEGSNFARGAQAQLGGQPLTQLTWVNPSVLTGVTPAGMAPGSYDLSVTNPNGASATLHGGIAVAGGSPSPSAAPGAEATTRATSPAPAPTQTPPATRSPAPATRSPAPSTPSPTATPAATRAPTRTPQPRPAATAAPDAGAADVSGTWQITDGVTYGPGSGQSFNFTVTLSQQGARFSGSGDGLSIGGTVNGATLHAEYTQDNGTNGTFDWTLAPDGDTFAGTFTNSSGNGGTSSGQRLSAAFAVAPSNEKPPAAVPVGEADGRGGRKKKER
jgi:hypothetical protein